MSLGAVFSAVAVWQWLIIGPYIGQLLSLDIYVTAYMEGRLRQVVPWLLMDCSVAGPCLLLASYLLHHADKRGILMGIVISTLQLAILVAWGASELLSSGYYVGYGTIFIGPVLVIVSVALTGLLIPLVRSLFILRNARGFEVEVLAASFRDYPTVSNREK